jgi:8-oxo-dGTP pyrophosphatase MutT (NUDIX family)
MITVQSAAIPYRRNKDATLEVLLVTSRRKGRWVLPKGKIKRGLLPHTSAAREAFEEAGVVGEIDRAPIGQYRQRASGAAGPGGEIVIQAFALKVITEHRSWPEMSVRRRHWMPLAAAINSVGDANLREILRTFHEVMAASRALP